MDVSLLSSQLESVQSRLEDTQDIISGLESDKKIALKKLEKTTERYRLVVRLMSTYSHVSSRTFKMNKE